MEQLGNPLIDDYHDNIGTHEYWWNHGLISDSTYESLKKGCRDDSFLFPRDECNAALSQAFTEFGDINPYSLYTKTCYDDGTASSNNLNLPLVSTSSPNSLLSHGHALASYFFNIFFPFLL
jgi:serine carboxypeptidase-like clade 2